MKQKFTRLIKPGLPLYSGIAMLSLGLCAPEIRAANLPAELNPIISGISPFRQELTIQGTVKDEKGLGLPGVSVKIKGTQTAVSTDGNGKYAIKVPTSAAILVFNFIGYEAYEAPVGSKTTIDVQLKPSSTMLENVEIVSVGYGTLSSKEVTSAVTHVSAEKFNRGGSRNPLDLIQGKVAGLQLTRTGGSNPNAGVATQLRGAVSVKGTGAPLYVIDGIPGGNPDLLQQDDIESIDVLKDGSGAAIYGTSANAGVILITTKKGKAGPPVFDYSTYFRKEYVQNRQEFLTADEYRQKIASGELKQQDFGNSTDFYDEMINHGNLSMNHNLSLSGGTDKSSYRASVNYRNLDGIGKENGREEYTLRLNVNQKGLNDRLNIQMNLATNINKANMLGGDNLLGDWESEMAKNPTLSNYNPDGSYRFDLTSTNFYARLAQEKKYRKQQTSSADAKVDLQIVDGLKASIFGSVTRNNFNDGAYRIKMSEDSKENSDFPEGGFASRGMELEQKYALEPTLQYQKTFAEKHSVTAIGGYSYRYNMRETSLMENRGFINDIFHEDRMQEGAALGLGKAKMESGKQDDTLVAFFGRVNYALDNKYLLQFIMRREGSSKFGANNRWGNFPAVSVGWNISEESFMKEVSFVSYLKLRAGYGVTGNTPVDNNVSRVTMGGGGKYLFPDGNYYQTYGPDRNPNPNLKWETKRELNIGLDFKLADSRLSGSIDVFKRTTKDLLDEYTSPQPPFVRDRIFANVGTISSKGIELALSYAAINNDNFTWSMDATASTIKNTLDSYSNSQYKVLYNTFGDIGGAGDLGRAITTFEGGEVGVFYGKRFAGLTPEGKWLFYNRNGEAVTNDKINVSYDKNLTDLAPLGRGTPKYYMSWTNNFTYKNFDLRVFLRGKFDYKILNTTALTYGNQTWSGNLLKETFGKYAGINDTYMYSDYYLENGSHIKIDEVTLGYTIKSKSNWFRNARVYVTGQNLATITGYSGNDPDFISDTGLGPGVDLRNMYPSTRSFLVGLNVGF